SAIALAPIRVDREQRDGRDADLPKARRDPARDRARGRANRDDAAARALAPAGYGVRGARERNAHRGEAAAHSRSDARLELRPARRGRATIAAPPRGVRWRLLARRGGGRV